MSDSTISHHTALVYMMVVVSAADGEMNDRELSRMGQLVQNLPVFKGYNAEKLLEDAETCAQILENEADGLDTVIGLALEAIPNTHGDTAYAVVCDVAAADGELSQEELRVLEIIRNRFDLERIISASIERSITARYRPL
ncbi:MAG: tellurite resistance TerB family protein [Sphingomonadales bacterium]|nr:tellurite resistance TerB family protein [Sphingomonadales bacterium]